MAINLKDYIVDVNDFPKKGIVFKDITPVFENNKAFQKAIDEMASLVEEDDFDKIICADARGFLVGSALAYKLNKGLILARKPGKLPRPGYESHYELEYGSNSLVISVDSIKKGDRLLLTDDLLATGGSAQCMYDLAKGAGGEIVSAVFLVILESLEGETKLKNLGIKVDAPIRY